MSGTFRNDITSTGQISSKRQGMLIGSMVALPIPSAEYEGITIQYLGETIEGTIFRQYNTFLCKKLEDGTYAWTDNSPAGGGKWGKILGNLSDQGDLNNRLNAIIQDGVTGPDSTWSSNALSEAFSKLAAVANVFVVPTRPETGILNSIYYVGTASPYRVWLYAKNAEGTETWFDMGTTEISLSNYYTRTQEDTTHGALESSITALQTSKVSKTGHAVNKVLTTDADGTIVVSTVSGTELSYLSGLTSPVSTLLGNKQNKVIYATTLPDPSTLETGDLVIKEADDGVWAKVNPSEIINDATASGTTAYSSNKVNLISNELKVGKQNRVLTGTTDPSSTVGETGDIFIKYGEEDTWSSVEPSKIIDDSTESTTKTWSSTELKTRFQALAGGARVEIVASKPATGVLNTTYYVGTASPYHIWLYANNSLGVATWFDLGITSIDFSDYYKKTEADAKFLPKTDCTIPVGGIFETLDTTIVPGTKWAGTTWEALPDYKEWDEVSEKVLTNPAGVTGVVAYSVHNNVVTVKFDSIKCELSVTNYFYNIPEKYNPNANQLCVVLNAWDDLTTKTFACVNTALPEGNVYLRKITDTDNTQYGFISYPCGGGTPDRTFKRYKRTA